MEVTPQEIADVLGYVVMGLLGWGGKAWAVRRNGTAHTVSDEARRVQMHDLKGEISTLSTRMATEGRRLEAQITDVRGEMRQGFEKAGNQIAELSKVVYRLAGRQEVEERGA